MASVRRSPGLLLTGATAISVLALLCAFGAVLLASQAVDRANEAKEIALARPADGASDERRADSGPRSVPTAPAEPGGPSAGQTDVPGSDEPPRLDERTVYAVKYEKETLTLRANPASSMAVDLDEPRANVARDSDLQLQMQYGTEQLQLMLEEDVEGSESTNSALTPYDCAERIRTAPLGDGSVPVRQGLVLCVKTSFKAAKDRGDQQRMVLLEVTGVSADKAVTVVVTAWNIPR